MDEEDIENVPNLATADIVELMLNTKIAPNRIIDWVDQSMLLMVLPPAPKKGAQNWIGTVLRNNGIRTASALVAATQTHQGQAATIVEFFPEDMRTQVISLAAAVQIYPNYPMIQNWLSTEPFFPPNQEQNAAPVQVAPPEVAPILALATADPSPHDLRRMRKSPLWLAMWLMAGSWSVVITKPSKHVSPTFATGPRFREFCSGEVVMGAKNRAAALPQHDRARTRRAPREPARDTGCSAHSLPFPAHRCHRAASPSSRRRVVRNPSKPDC